MCFYFKEHRFEFQGIRICSSVRCACSRERHRPQAPLVSSECSSNMVATKEKANRDMCKSQHTKEPKYTVRVNLCSKAKNDYRYKAIKKDVTN